MPIIEDRVWKGVPLALVQQWTEAFSEQPAKIKLHAACPVCGQRSLICWHDGGRGLWEWCESCFSYEHSSALPPEGWVPDPAVRPIRVTAEPTAIVVALKNAGIL